MLNLLSYIATAYLSISAYILVLIFVEREDRFDAKTFVIASLLWPVGIIEAIRENF